MSPLEKHPPNHEGEAEADDCAQDKGVAPLADVDLGHEGVYHWEAVGEVIHLGLDHLKGLPLGLKMISGVHGDGDLLVNHPLRVS